MDIHVEVWSGPHGAFPPPRWQLSARVEELLLLFSFQEAT